MSQEPWLAHQPLPQRKEYWGVQLSPGESESMPFGAGGTISVIDMRGGTGRSYPVWTGVSRTLVAQVNADQMTNIAFQIMSQSP